MGIYRAVMGGQLLGQTVQNVCHFEKGGDWDPAQAQTLAQHLRDNWITQIKSRLSTQMTWTGITIYDRLTPGRQPVVLAINLQGAQTTFATQAVPFCAVLMRFKTSQTGPSGRGRIYIPGAALNDYAGGNITAPAATAWQTILNTIGPMYTSNNPSSGFNLVLSGKQAPSATLNVTTIEIGGHYGVQRRRNIGVGV